MNTFRKLCALILSLCLRGGEGADLGEGEGCPECEGASEGGCAE